MPQSAHGVARRAKRDEWRSQPRQARGGGVEFCISSLPTETQKALMDQLLTKPSSLSPERAAELDMLARQIELIDPSVKNRHNYSPLSEKDRDALWRNFEARSKAAKAKVERKISCLQAAQHLMIDSMGRTEAIEVSAPQFGFGVSTVYRMFDMVRGHDPSDWGPLLIGKKPGGVRRAEFSDEALDYIKGEYLTQVRQPLATIIYRARLYAKKMGWTIPSDWTIRNLINAIPRREVVFARQGATALHYTYQHQIRDYSTLAVNELWEADGHKADVFCRDSSGKVFRPMVEVFRDVRTRRVLGWSIAETESSELVRKALHNAIKNCKSLPRNILLDNGRGGASKAMTGGQKTRFRGTISAEETNGIITTLGINVHWATPGRGQSKPIERFFRSYADNVDKRFPNAYCGNTPDARPESFDPKNAVDLDIYRAAIEAWFVEYNERSHTGDSMDGRSPKDVYSELVQVTPVRTPTDAQLRLSMMTAESVILQSKAQHIRLMGNIYWCEALADLNSRGPYTVRYDADDVMKSVYLYDGEELIAEVPLWEKSGFLSKQDAKDHTRNRRKANRAIVQLDKANREARRLRNKIHEESAQLGPFDAPAIPQTYHPKPQPSSFLPQKPVRASKADILDMAEIQDALARKRKAEAS